MSIKWIKGIIIMGLLLAVGVFYVSPAMAQDAQTSAGCLLWRLYP